MSTIFSRVCNIAKTNQLRRKAGELVCIPFNKLFPRLSTIIPGIIKERYILITANSKVGKSKIARAMYVMYPYWYIYEYLKGKSNIKLKIFIFSLEESKEKVIGEIAVNMLYRNKVSSIDIQNLYSYFDNYIVDDKILQELHGYAEWFEHFESIVEVIDNIRNPFGIYNYVRKYAESHGSYVKKELMIDGKKTIVDDYYIPNDPDEYVIILTDHIGKLKQEKDDKDIRETITNMSNYYMHMRDRWKYIPVAVQQQTLAQESTDNFKLNKLQPSANGLGENKIISQDVNLILGLFAPARHNIALYDGYDTEQLGDNFRELSVIYHREGGMCEVPLWFNGAVNHFEELPRPMKKEDYERFKLTK